MKTQAMFQPCPICGAITNPRSKTCGACAIGGNKIPADIVTLECENCKETFQIPRWRHNQNRGKFCSRQCANDFLKTITGPNHAKYTGKLVTKYVGASWKIARQAALNRAGGKCESCGCDLSTVYRFVVHHNIGVHEFETPDMGHTLDNLTVLCRSCHAKHHGLGKMPVKAEGQ